MKNDENAANSPGEQTPRVCLTYDVEIEGRIESRELPFVIGVLSDLSGCPENPPLPLAERKFVRVDNGNFDQVMASFSPRLDLRIADHFKIGEPMLHLLLGFFALSDFDPVSCRRPPQFDAPLDTAAARSYERLPMVMVVSRFAHYLKAMVRDRKEAFTCLEDCRIFLNRWVMNYWTGNDDASMETKARYPLREALIELSEVPKNPGHYAATAFLGPHFQLEYPGISARIVVDLPAPAHTSD